MPRRERDHFKTKMLPLRVDLVGGIFLFAFRTSKGFLKYLQVRPTAETLKRQLIAPKPALTSKGYRNLEWDRGE